VKKLFPVMMLWTAPPPGTRVPWIWELLGLPRYNTRNVAFSHSGGGTEPRAARRAPDPQLG